MFVPSLEALVPVPGADADGSPGGSEDEAEPGKVPTRVKKIRKPLSRREPRFLYLSC